jgi:hypothetical protein
MSIFLVVYTAAGLIGAVSKSLPMDVCETSAMVNADKPYTFKCEEHKSRPKVQTKIDPEDRRRFESDCFNFYGAVECKELPNGDLRIESKFRDKRGGQLINIIKLRDRTKHF